MILKWHIFEVLSFYVIQICVVICKMLMEKSLYDQGILKINWI